MNEVHTVTADPEQWNDYYVLIEEIMFRRKYPSKTLKRVSL